MLIFSIILINKASIQVSIFSKQPSFIQVVYKNNQNQNSETKSNKKKGLSFKHKKNKKYQSKSKHVKPPT